MATNTAGTNARKYPTQQVHYLHKDLVFGDDGHCFVVHLQHFGSVGCVVIFAEASLAGAFPVEIFCRLGKFDEFRHS